MTNYEIFDLLYSEFKHNFEDDILIFNQKYTVRKQRTQSLCLKDEKKN